MRLISLLLGLTLSTSFLSQSCKRNVENKSSQREVESSNQVATIAIRDEIPSELSLLFKVLTGEQEKFHDGYYQQVLSTLTVKGIVFSNEVPIKYETSEHVEKGVINTVTNTDLYRGIEIGSRFYVFKVVKGQTVGGSSENGPWWHPYKSYPNSLLPSATFEERIKHVLNTEIYDKMELGKKLEALDGIEMALGFLPGYAGSKSFFYEDKKVMGAVMVFGDIASLGMASKVKAIATGSKMVVVATSSARVVNGGHEIATGKGGVGSGIDIALASVEGAFAIVGLANLKFSLPKKVNNTQELVDNLGDKRIFLVDNSSAPVISNKLGKSADDIIKNGLDANDIEKLTGIQRSAANSITKVLSKADIEKNLDEIYKLAPAAKQEIDDIADAIANQVGGQVAKAPLKGKARALEKVMNDYGGDVTKLKDLARNTVIVDEENLNVAVSMLKEKGAKVKVIDGSLDPMGYSGVNSSVVTKNGMAGEIQVNTPQMIFGKELPEIAQNILGKQLYNKIASKAGVPGGKGHELYEKWRALAQDSPLRSQLEKESRTYYETIRKNTK